MDITSTLWVTFSYFVQKMQKYTCYVYYLLINAALTSHSTSSY